MLLGNSQIIKYPFQKCPGKDLSGFENLTGLDMGILIFASYLTQIQQFADPCHTH